MSAALRPIDMARLPAWIERSHDEYARPRGRRQEPRSGRSGGDGGDGGVVPEDETTSIRMRKRLDETADHIFP